MLRGLKEEPKVESKEGKAKKGAAGKKAADKKAISTVVNEEEEKKQGE